MLAFDLGAISPTAGKRVALVFDAVRVLGDAEKLMSDGSLALERAQLHLVLRRDRETARQAFLRAATYPETHALALRILHSLDCAENGSEPLAGRAYAPAGG